MSKLTPEEKARNKKATAARNAAYSRRKRQYTLALETTRGAVDMTPAAQAAEKADAAFDAAIKARDADRAALQEQIRQLTLKLEESVRAHQAILEPLAAARKAAWDAKRQAQREAEADVRAQFADVADCFSAGRWKSIEAFLSEATDSPTEPPLR